MADNHVKKLNDLCRFCCFVISNDSFVLKTYSEDILKYFYINVNEDDEKIHPKKMCLKCYSKLQSIKKRGTTTERNFATWKPHTSSCVVCNQLCEKMKGGRPKKKARSGRPPQQAMTISNRWTVTDSKNLSKTVPDNPNPRMDLNLFNQDDILQLVKCPICKKMLWRPILNINCHHITCLNCILSKFEGQLIENLICPVADCHHPFGTNSFVYSNSSIELIKRIRLKCTKNCGKTFLINEIDEKNKHDKKCFGGSSSTNKTPLSTVFEINKDNEIPKIVEDAAVHVIKTKLAKSGSKQISFNTGGSRVS